MYHIFSPLSAPIMRDAAGHAPGDVRRTLDEAGKHFRRQNLAHNTGMENRYCSMAVVLLLTAPFYCSTGEELESSTPARTELTTTKNVSSFVGPMF